MSTKDERDRAMAKEFFKSMASKSDRFYDRAQMVVVAIAELDAEELARVEAACAARRDSLSKLS